MRRLSLGIAAILAVLSNPVFAQTASATGDQIKAAVSGNTVSGAMTDTGGYTEYYAPDGTIRGKSYAGTWSIETDKMCFQYDKDNKSCWQALIWQGKISWVRDGAVVGDGAVMPGNPNKF
jgi:hypothetical protein